MEIFTESSFAVSRRTSGVLNAMLTLFILGVAIDLFGVFMQSDLFSGGVLSSGTTGIADVISSCAEATVMLSAAVMLCVFGRTCQRGGYRPLSFFGYVGGISLLLKVLIGKIPEVWTMVRGDGVTAEAELTGDFSSDVFGLLFVLSFGSMMSILFLRGGGVVRRRALWSIVSSVVFCLLVFAVVMAAALETAIPTAVLVVAMLLAAVAFVVPAVMLRKLQYSNNEIMKE